MTRGTAAGISRARSNVSERQGLVARANENPQDGAAHHVIVRRRIRVEGAKFEWDAARNVFQPLDLRIERILNHCEMQQPVLLISRVDNKTRDVSLNHWPKCLLH